MSDREGHGHKAVLYKSHFPPLRHSFSQRHHCIHRLINHVYNKETQSFLFIAPRQLQSAICICLLITQNEITACRLSYPETESRTNTTCNCLPIVMSCLGETCTQTLCFMFDRAPVALHNLVLRFIAELS